MTLEEYKKKYKLNNSQLAALFGVSNATVHHWLSGYSRPSHKHVYKILVKSKGEITLEGLGLLKDV